jgi:hypothetical protein
MPRNSTRPKKGISGSSRNGGKLQAPRTKHTNFVRYQQRFGKGLLWIAAGITMVAMVLIVGYIIINGVYTRFSSDDSVMPHVEERVVMDRNSTYELSVIANRTLRLPDVTYEELREIFFGLNPFLGYLTKQNRNARLFVFNDPNFTGYAERYVLGDENSFGTNVTLLTSREKLLEQVKNDKGAIALVPSEWLDGIRGVRVVGVRQISVVVNPNILSLQAGRRLDTLEPEQVRALLSGDAEVWSEVGGPRIEIDPADLSEGYEGVYEPLGVTPVIFDPGHPIQGGLVERGLGPVALSGETVYVDTVEEFHQTLADEPGGVGLIRRREAMERDQR